MIKGFAVDKPKYKKSFGCLFGFHSASRYLIERIDDVDYFICKHFGKRFRILPKGF